MIHTARVLPDRSCLQPSASPVRRAGAGATAPRRPPALKPNDYADEKNWLCRPGRKGDACDVDLTTTVVAADGTLTRETLDGESEGADRLLLRVSHRVDGPGASTAT